MQMLNKTILLSLFIILPIYSCADTKMNYHQSAYEPVGLKFVNLNKIVWVYASKGQTIPESHEIIKSKYRQYRYEVANFEVINFPPARFENKNGELFVNGLSLGKDTTAVVGKYGAVYIGQFISNTFE